MIDTRERVLYANDTLGHWVRRPPSDIENGMAMGDILTKGSHLLFQTQVAPMIQLQGFAREILCSLRVCDRDEPLPVLMNAVLRVEEGDLPARIDFAFFDATERANFERRLRERQKEAEELAVIVRNAKVGVFRCDQQGRIKRLNEAAARMLGLELGNVPRQPIGRLLSLDGNEKDWFLNAVRGRKSDCTFEASRKGEYFNISIGEIANPEEPYAEREYSVILRDISQRVLAEQRMELLVGELNHRIRNIFSIILGMIRQSLRAVPAERDKLIDRVSSMARSHDILTGGYWKDASIWEIISPIQGQAGDGQKVVVAGPDLRLVPTQFKALSMAIHELATNARKYGALCADQGMVEIRWSVRDTQPRIIDFLWRESGGPPVTVPKKKGFGSAVIERALVAEFDGSAEVRYQPDGLEFTFRGVVKP